LNFKIENKQEWYNLPVNSTKALSSCIPDEGNIMLFVSLARFSTADKFMSVSESAKETSGNGLTLDKNIEC
jgi:hypothetical protein